MDDLRDILPADKLHTTKPTSSSSEQPQRSPKHLENQLAAPTPTNYTSLFDDAFYIQNVSTASKPPSYSFFFILLLYLHSEPIY